MTGGEYAHAAVSTVLEPVRRRLADQPGPVTAARVAAALAELGVVLGAAGVLELCEELEDELTGAGPLQPLLRLAGVSDVLVNGPGSVWVDRGAGPERTDVDVGDEAALRALACRLAAAAGRRLDDASPYADARLPDGTRLHAVLPPVAVGGTHLCLRVPAPASFDLAGLVAAGGVPPAWAPVLRALVRSRTAFLVSGGTGAGKTTLLGAMLGECAPTERIVLVEDAAELRPDHPHVVRLEARHANVEGRGGVALDVLVRQALRMRPDRLVVGECRGAEVRDLLTALNTGHEGGCGTVHANTAADVPARLQALGALAGLSPAAVALQAGAAFAVVLHIQRQGHDRRLVEIAAVTTPRPGEVVVVPALVADRNDPTTPGRAGPGWGRLARRLGLTSRLEGGWPDGESAPARAAVGDDAGSP